MEPITFEPIYMERVWGGRVLNTLYRRKLPGQDTPIGEAWELVDRPEAQSISNHGPTTGTSLHDLWTAQRDEIFGCTDHPAERFPLLMKILDCTSDLSIQVHPPADVAAELGGEPKSEMWFIAECDPGSILYAGLKKGVTKQAFHAALMTGRVAECVHPIAPDVGDSIYIPSGRLHAIGGGFLIHEIQQNSDTTYRVFDWNRVDAEGNSRELHIEPSMASINFEDTEPEMDIPNGNVLASCEHFHTRRLQLESGKLITNPTPDRFSIVSITKGTLTSKQGREFTVGDSMLLPRGAEPLTAAAGTTVLQITLPTPA